MIYKKYCWNVGGYIGSARDFPWTVPAGHAVLLVIPGSAVGLTNRLRRGFVSRRAGAWLFASLAIWGALLRMPIYDACSFLLAAGLGRLISEAFAARLPNPRRARYILVALVGLLGILSALSTGREAIQEYRAVAGLKPAPAGARNVVLIVWDTVRAYDLSLYGYRLNTTPNLARWAGKGVRYNQALAPAPWTYPSHTSFFTGKWPFQLNSQWKFALDGSNPTIAEYLASRGYQTAGFAANTNWCSHESGLARGFAHFEDYPLTLRSLFSRTVPGNWALQNIFCRSNYYDRKWIALQSRGGQQINGAFLDWLRRRRPDRPFFAFLNYFDAHEPYVAPPGHEGRFGIRPRSASDYQFLFDYVGIKKNEARKRDILITPKNRIDGLTPGRSLPPA